MLPCRRENIKNHFHFFNTSSMSFVKSFIFSDIMKRSPSWAMNQGDEYQNVAQLFEIGDELEHSHQTHRRRWSKGDSDHRRSGNQALHCFSLSVNVVPSSWRHISSLFKTTFLRKQRFYKMAIVSTRRPFNGVNIYVYLNVWRFIFLKRCFFVNVDMIRKHFS